ncbi:MAG: Heme synthase [Pseudomonadota bacterium]|jgi:cytochrome c oxidase assembly protein subunit 15
MNTLHDAISAAPSTANPRRAIRFRRGLARYTLFVAVWVALLIYKGALVTSHDAGLSVPDWPTSYGENMFLFPPSLWIGPIFFEHVHRLLASFVGLLTVILAAWIWFVEGRRWVRWLAAAALGMVILQGVLGGLTVIYQLPTAISAAHGVLGQTFFIVTIILAYSQSKEWFVRQGEAPAVSSSRYFRGSLLVLTVIYIQLIVGAVMRHAGAGLAIPDFPTMGGVWWPSFAADWIAGINEVRRGFGFAPVDSVQISLHLFHRLWGIVVAAVILSFGYKLRRWSEAGPRVSRAALVLSAVVAVQFTLGIVAVMSRREPFLTSLHVLFGALTLALAVVLGLRLYNFKTAQDG